MVCELINAKGHVMATCPIEHLGIVHFDIFGQLNAKFL
jgi:hypothetical protein